MGFIGEGRLEMFSTAAGGFVPVCAEEWLSSDLSSSSGQQQLAEFDWSRNTCRLLGYDEVQVCNLSTFKLLDIYFCDLTFKSMGNTRMTLTT